MNDFLDNLKMYTRFAFGLRKFLTEKMTFEDARRIIKKRMEQRQDNFLNIIKKGIFGYKKSPYLQLLKLAKYEYQDVEKLATKHGVEETLNILKNDGIYFTIQEFKGKSRVIRKGKEFLFKESDFDNPYTAPCYESRTGGTRSAGTRVMVDFDFLSQAAVNYGVTSEVERSGHIILYPAFPHGLGVRHLLFHGKFGISPLAWFSLANEKECSISLKSRLGVLYVLYMSKIFGTKFPMPQFMGIKDIPKVVEFIHTVLKERKECCIAATVSLAVRICLAAKEKGMTLKGAKFYIGGEPFTLAKYKEIISVGAGYIHKYGYTEAGLVASQCFSPSGFDDVHLIKDRFVLISHKREVADSYVDAFLFTTLLPSAPKILLNVENGDYGEIDSRRCGCSLDDLGYDTHIHNIRSFEKLTGEGMTFYGTNLMRLVEEVLPLKFGGSNLDYQLVEEEDDLGITRLVVMVNPKIDNLDESHVIKTVLDGLKEGGDSQRVMTEVWSQAGTVRVRRDYPILSKTGKLYPLYIVRKEARR